MGERKEKSPLVSCRRTNLSKVQKWLLSRPIYKLLAQLALFVFVIIVFITICLLRSHSSSKYLVTRKIKINNMEENTVYLKNVEKEFQKQWFRMQKARVDWEAMIAPCTYINSVKNKSLIGWGKINETSNQKSFVEYMDIRPAGQFSRIFIRTRTKDGRDKTIGGDFWMVSYTLIVIPV